MSDLSPEIIAMQERGAELLEAQRIRNEKTLEVINALNLSEEQAQVLKDQLIGVSAETYDSEADRKKAGLSKAQWDAKYQEFLARRGEA